MPPPGAIHGHPASRWPCPVSGARGPAAPPAPPDISPRGAPREHNNICTPKSGRIDPAAVLQLVDERAVRSYISVHSAGGFALRSYERPCATLPIRAPQRLHRDHCCCSAPSPRGSSPLPASGALGVLWRQRGLKASCLPVPRPGLGTVLSLFPSVSSPRRSVTALVSPALRAADESAVIWGLKVTS